VEGKAQFVRVEAERGQPVPVSDIPGRMIISDGRERLQDNDAVKPDESTSDAEINFLKRFMEILQIFFQIFIPEVGIPGKSSGHNLERRLWHKSVCGAGKQIGKN
jgi:hypothetical protein